MVAAAKCARHFLGLDGTALVVAASILALLFFRKGNDSVAAGFLVYAIGEAVMLGGTAGSLEASVPSFAAGTALWSAGLLLTSVPKAFVIWTRLAGLIAAILFAITSARIFWGEQTPAHLQAAPLLRVSLPRAHLHRLDLDHLEEDGLNSRMLTDRKRSSEELRTGVPAAIPFPCSLLPIPCLLTSTGRSAAKPQTAAPATPAESPPAPSSVPVALPCSMFPRIASIAAVSGSAFTSG